MTNHVFSEREHIIENHTLLLQMGNLKIQKLKYKFQ